MTIAELLEASRADFCEAVEGLSDEQASRKPAPDRWSVLECMEHVVTVEHRFLGWLREAGTNPEPLADAAKEAKLASMLADRSTKVMAPEAVHPTGKYSSITAALAEFNAARALSLEFAGKPVVELYALAAKHPRFGPVNGTELITIIASHSRRHAAQIRETRDTLAASA